MSIWIIFMKKTPSVPLSLFLPVLLTILAGCGRLQEPVVLDTGGMRHVIEMEASNFSFAPNNLQAHRDDTLLLRLNNSTGAEHNITIRGPAGEIVSSMDLPAGKTTSVSLGLSRAGEYTFYCDKPFHGPLGMRGRITAVPL
jgi:plastocyanin